MDLKILLRQIYVCSGPWTHYFLSGFCVGFQTVLVPQLRKEKQNVSIEQVSWLAALQMYSAIPWIIILSILVNVIGRKKSYIIVCICSLVTFIAFYFSTNMTHFLIAQICYGGLSSSYLTTSLVILAEYSSVKYRGMFLALKTASSYWGVLVANSLGTYFYWRNVVILGLVCSVYTLLNAIIMPESPLWLAAKGRFVECAAAHRWLKGNGEESEKELDRLLKSNKNRPVVKARFSILSLYRTICRKRFLKPILLANGLVCLYCVTGKPVCTIYSLDILKKITSSESTAYTGMLILDGASVASMYLGSLLSKLLRRRIMLLGFLAVGIILMAVIALYLYLAKLAIIDENKYLSILLLGSYSISISGGPLIMATSIIGEIIPMESRSLSLGIVALFYKFSLGTTLKLSPFYFKHFGMHGVFAFFATMSIFCFAILYVYLPETKDKTLQEIDECLKGVDKGVGDESTELMNNVTRRQ